MRPNRILAEPATPQACAADLHTRGQRMVQAGEARSQFAETRQNASNAAGAKSAGRRRA